MPLTNAHRLQQCSGTLLHVWEALGHGQCRCDKPLGARTHTIASEEAPPRREAHALKSGPRSPSCWWRGAFSSVASEWATFCRVVDYLAVGVAAQPP